MHIFGIVLILYSFQETLLKHLFRKKIAGRKMVQNCKHFRFHDVTCPKRMGAIFDTDPKTPSAPAGTNVSSRGALQKFWEFRSFLEHSSVGTRLVSLTRCHVTSWTARSWTGLGLGLGLEWRSRN